ncbi:677_t:CDS:2 [Acaulospora morrowiae]|uniref:677_t:CDS:1 n=1 Tax=Acaulospora morrowiae TaxID=94023 RepID=A0A9N9CF92_9GLOM|nr:677_t:CDS:2 [Acaulospora morrowiae]
MGNVISNSNVTSTSSNLAFKNGICPHCSQPNTGIAWCKSCDPGRFRFEGHTSGNNSIDEFIMETQLCIENYTDRHLEWIPFDRFKDISVVGEGGFGTVYKAIWIDGKRDWIAEEVEGKMVVRKERQGEILVALKSIKNSKNMSKQFLHEIKTHWKCLSELFLQFYGITTNPETEEIIMVTQYASHGNLRTYLSKNYKHINWKAKLEWLTDIAKDLEMLHHHNFTHRDLHSGNILIVKDERFNRRIESKLTDFGLAQPANRDRLSGSIGVFGVLPYVAPEVLKGRSYTTAADMYSFGIIMAEMSTGKLPFGDRPHDSELTLDICNGLRPDFADGTPEFYVELSRRCCDSDPVKRPSAMHVWQIITTWERFINDPRKEYKSAFEAADKIRLEIVNKQDGRVDSKIHANAVYTSRLLNYCQVQSSNKTDKIDFCKIFDSTQIDLSIPEDLLLE